MNPNAARQPAIFINYRRVLSKSEAINIRNELEKHFGENSLFLDTQDIIPGDYWRKKIQQGLEHAKILLPLLPVNWLQQQHPESGMRRLDDPEDWVRKEIAWFLMACQTDKSRCIIPLLLDEGKMPKANYLPNNLKGLPDIQNPPQIRTTNLKYDLLAVVDKIVAMGIPKISSSQVVTSKEAYPLPAHYQDFIPQLQHPYVGLRHFERQEACLYFGRKDDITKVINLIGQPDYRLFLLYGPSGVGKSSFLNAGVLPRIESKYHIHSIVRRSFEMGLHEQLEQAIASLQNPNKPSLIILDQVEEMFTNFNPKHPQEAPQFFTWLAQAIGKIPNLKILLSFRFEHYTKIEAPIQEKGLTFQRHALSVLSQKDVEEAITGVTKNEALQKRFRLEINPALVALMCEKVCADQDSHIAPLLQLQLRNLWDAAVALDKDEPIFDKSAYKRFQKTGLPQMVAFQLDQLSEASQPYRKSGLILDILHHLVTPRQTAGNAKLLDLQARYAHIKDFIALLEQLKSTYLVLSIEGGQSIRLAHDSLAPIVAEKFNQSMAVGQRAGLIAQSKIRDYQQGLAINFSETDIEAILEGLLGMPKLPEAILAQVKSDEARYQAQRVQNFNLAFSTATKAVEDLDHETALNSLQIAAREALHSEKVHQLAKEVPYLLHLLPEKEAVLESALQFLHEFAPDKQLLHYLENIAYSKGKDFATWLQRWDEKLHTQMLTRYFPNMIPVEGGTFQMGSEEGYDDEKPIHKVTVSSYGIADTPVTVWQYGLYCLMTGTKIPNDSGFGRGQRPIINVNWFDACRYCNWLSTYQGLQPVYGFESSDKVMAKWDANGYRLPTEAEWEFAARARGGKARFGNGQDIARISEMNFDVEHDYNEKYNKHYYEKGESYGSTTPVKQFPPNKLGLYDMSGNVYEWCWDKFSSSYYQESDSATDPRGALDFEQNNYGHVVRGGSWNIIALYARSSFRVRFIPILTYVTVGFRVVRCLPF